MNKAKTIIAVLAIAGLLMGTVARGYGQITQPLIVPASLQVIDALTTRTSLTVRLTAGTNPVNGFDVQYFKRGAGKHIVSFPDSLQPGESLEFLVDGLECDTGYRVQERSSAGEHSTAVSTLTSECN